MSDMTVDAAKVVAKLQVRLTDAITQVAMAEVALEDSLGRELALRAELEELKAAARSPEKPVAAKKDQSA